MNPRVLELLEQSTVLTFDGSGSDTGKKILNSNKFAELIVEECSVWLDGYFGDDYSAEAALDLYRHFGMTYGLL